MITLRAGSATDVGLVRSSNQDSFLIAHPLYAVADGMGGAAAGEVASSMAVEVLQRAFIGVADESPTPERLIEAAKVANRAVWDAAVDHPEMRGMGTTLVALALVEDGRLAIANIGDSRLYRLHGGDLRQVTTDHNFVAEMVAEGRISPEEAEFHPRRNIMTRALGPEPEVPVDLFLEEPEAGDRYLLCSDGLPREVHDQLIASLLTRLQDPQEAATELVEEAKRRGGNDNITVVVVDVVADDGTAQPQQEVRTPAPEGEPTAADPTVTSVVPKVKPRPSNPVTPRVVGFILVLLFVLGGAAAAVVWYARDSYFVGLEGNQVVIYQGRPGGVAGIDPTVKAVTGHTVDQVQTQYLPDLRAGHETPTYQAARSYVNDILTPPTTTPPPPTTVAPSPTSVPLTTSTT